MGQNADLEEFLGFMRAHEANLEAGLSASRQRQAEAEEAAAAATATAAQLRMQVGVVGVHM